MSRARSCRNAEVKAGVAMMVSLTFSVKAFKINVVENLRNNFVFPFLHFDYPRSLFSFVKHGVCLTLT